MKSLKSLVIILIFSVFTNSQILGQSPGGDPPFPYNVTGTGSYILGASGLPVGLSGSDVGVVYTLYKDGVAQTPTVPGTGSPVSFGNQLAGTYTVVGTSQYGLGVTQMAGNAVIVENSFNHLMVKVYLEGLWNATTSQMNKCQKFDEGAGSLADQFPGSVVDTITVELHDVNDYSVIAYQFHALDLNQDGTVTTHGKSYIEVPSSITGSYILTVKTRNHLETCSATSLSFDSETIEYDFTTSSAKAYVYEDASYTSMKNKDGVWVVYAGNVNRADDYPEVSFFDIMQIYNNYSDNTGVYGYSANDLNGDGYVDVSDYMIAFNNEGVSFYR